MVFRWQKQAKSELVAMRGVDTAPVSEARSNYSELQEENPNEPKSQSSHHRPR